MNVAIRLYRGLSSCAYCIYAVFMSMPKSNSIHFQEYSIHNWSLSLHWHRPFGFVMILLLNPIRDSQLQSWVPSSVSRRFHAESYVPVSKTFVHLLQGQLDMHRHRILILCLWACSYVHFLNGVCRPIEFSFCRVSSMMYLYLLFYSNCINNWFIDLVQQYNNCYCHSIIDINSVLSNQNYV